MKTITVQTTSCRRATNPSPGFTPLAARLPGPAFRTLAAAGFLACCIPVTRLDAGVIAFARGNFGDQTEPNQTAQSGSVGQTYERARPEGSVASLARAAHGVLAAYAESHVTKQGNEPVAEATATAIFSDGFTVAAPGREGQAGTFTFKVRINGTLAATSRFTGVNDSSYARVALSINGNARLQASEALLANGSTLAAGPPFLNRELSVVVPFVFGRTAGLEFRLDVLSYAFGQWGADCIVDIGHTLEWGGIVSVNDASGGVLTQYDLTTNSGTDYSGPILDRPRLALVALGPAQLQLSWSTNFPAYAVESSATLAGGWQPVTTSPVTAGAQLTLAIEAATANQFFRLRKN